MPTKLELDQNEKDSLAIGSNTDYRLLEEQRDFCYGNFEKVGYVGQSFPTADHQITTAAGDLVLYNGDNICIFYGSNSWSYTRIGKLDNLSADEVRRFVKAGEGEVTITLSLQPIHTGIQELSPDENNKGTAYTITGQIAPQGYKGIVIQNGKKRINIDN